MHPVLDHIVLLVPYQTLQNLPTWLIDAFTILNGGAHAGGETENKLIVFRDGTYIELIAFVEGLDPEKRKQHRWGQRPEGRIIDWALSLVDYNGDDSHKEEEESGPAEVEFKEVQQRIREAQTGIEYEDPVAGGRTTPAGVVLKWATSSPVLSSSEEGNGNGVFGGGELPFWCLDRTPRPWRVPHLDAANVTHPSEITGIAGVTVSLGDQALLEKVGTVYEAIHGYSSGSTSAASATKEWQFKVPVSSSSSGWTLRLNTSGTSKQSPEPDVSVHLTFFTEGQPRKVQGTIADGREIVFELVNP